MFTNLEVRRQLVHIILGVLIVLLIHFDIVSKYFIYLMTFLVAVFSYLAYKKIKVPFFDYFLKHLQRKSELEGMPAKGLVFYMLGASLSLMLFSRNIALASILILAFGDSASRLFGPLGYVKHPFNNKKFIEGAFAGVIFSSLTAWMYVNLFDAVLASGVVMFIEGIDIRINNIKVDDNLTIPVVAGVFLIVLSLL